MTTDTAAEPTIDHATVGVFVDQVATDVAAAMSAPSVWFGARARAAEADAGVADRCTFEVLPATEIPDKHDDLVCVFDTLHDMADPSGAAGRARAVLSPGGTLMVVPPIADDRLEDNLHVIGRLSYVASTLVCTPCSPAGDGPGLGTQAGPARIQRLPADAGFRDVRVATPSDFNYVLEARP